jgi:hypothetical protein
MEDKIGGLMAQNEKWFQQQTLLGQEITAGDITVTPQSQALTLRWRGGGWVWNRPVAVLVERGGNVDRVPIIDVTRMAQIGLYGLGLCLTVLTLFVSTRRRRS